MPVIGVCYDIKGARNPFSATPYLPPFSSCSHIFGLLNPISALTRPVQISDDVYSPAAIRHNLALESIVGSLVDYVC